MVPLHLSSAVEAQQPPIVNVRCGFLKVQMGENVPSKAAEPTSQPVFTTTVVFAATGGVVVVGSIVDACLESPLAIVPKLKPISTADRDLTRHQTSKQHERKRT